MSCLAAACHMPCAPNHPLSSPTQQVVVTEGAPTYQGQQMARELAAAGIRATLIADSAVFAMMARVNKVGCCPAA